MNSMPGDETYSPLEEILNIYSHALGLILSIIALVLLTTHAYSVGDALYLFSFIFFGVGLVVLYAASTFYHSAVKPLLRQRLRIFDHSAIYVLITATYAPFTLITLDSVTGWVIFAACCSIAVAGVALKIFFTGKYDLLSTLSYVFMGWLIVFAISPLINSLPAAGFIWLVFGGSAYTLGAILYSFDRIKFNHAIFHVFVLLGSFCHFIAVYCYVLPK